MPVELAPGIYWVGAIDWTMRDFHGYLTEAGSTYNAYLIMDEHITLVDTVKGPFVPEMLERLREIVNPEQIEYIISNHVEMDHSSGMVRLVELVKPAKIFCSPQGKAGLSRHYKQDWPFVEVKTGTEVSLGRRTAMFLETPMLHWPDSMMTYLKEDQILFSSDGFGAHYASSARFDDQVPLHSEAYFYQLKKYYANILWPFGGLIAKLLKQVADLGLSIKIIAPDHGLIYRQNPGAVLEAYGRWARAENQAKALVIYDTMWHSTEMLAKALVQGLTDAGVEAQLHHLRRTHYSDIMAELLEAGLFFLGSPTLNNGMFPTVGQFLTYLKGLKPKNKTACAFGSYGWSGQAPGLITEELKAMGLTVPREGFRVKYIPDPAELAQARELAKTLAAEHVHV
jgi:flavorubredoxin